jgi:glycosyltransferase involved in cell wall biosynthesis
MHEEDQVPRNRFDASRQAKATPHLLSHDIATECYRSHDRLKALGHQSILVSKLCGSFLSVIIPAHNESASLPQLIEETIRSLKQLCDRSLNINTNYLSAFEIIVIDDGSTDHSWSILNQLACKYTEVRPLRLDRNIGQSAALTVGLHIARGDWIATLDADLQNDPADLTRLWNALPGYDVVLGWRAKRADKCLRRLVSRLANRVRNLTLDQSIRDTGCSIRLFPGSVALRLPLFHGFHRFMGPLLLREGCRIIQIPVRHRSRAFGRSHYNIWNRSISVVIDLIGVWWLKHRALRYSVHSLDPTHPITPRHSETQQNIWSSKNLEVV